MKITRQHFQLIADTLADMEPAGENPREYLQWEATVERFADRLGSTNPGFNRERFISACKG